MNMRRLSAFSALVTALAAATAWGQNSPDQGSSAVAAQASGQSAVTAGGQGASAQGGTGARADEGGSALASGSSVNAVLTRPVDSRRSKPGDPVAARTTQDARTESGASIPRGSLLMGHVAQTQTHGEGEAASSMAIVFDKAVTKDHHEIPLRSVAIQAVAAAEGAGAASLGETGGMMGANGGVGAGGGMGGSRGSGLGGGLVGHTTGALGGTLGSSAGGVAGGTGSLAATGAGALQAGPGATGGLDATGLLISQSTGVFGLHGVSLGSGATEAATGTVVSSSGKSVHLDQGTRLLLSSGPSSGASGEGASHRAPGAGGAADSRGDKGDRR